MQKECSSLRSCYATTIEAQRKKLLSAGKLWTDDDFPSLKLDTHWKEVIEKANSLSKQPARIFRAWEEEWEKVAVGANGDDVLEAMMVMKYGGIKWLDPDNSYRFVLGTWK